MIKKYISRCHLNQIKFSKCFRRRPPFPPPPPPPPLREAGTVPFSCSALLVALVPTCSAIKDILATRCHIPNDSFVVKHTIWEYNS